MKREIFISHKSTDISNAVGERIREEFKKEALKEKYDVFFDKDFLTGGMNWKKSIWTKLTQTDVVILVLDEETAQSDWVQREIDVARALKISVLPVVVGYSVEKVTNSLKRFDIEDIQAIQYKGFLEKDIQASVDEVVNLVDALSANTIEQQLIFFENGLNRRKTDSFKKTATATNPNCFIFKHPNHENLHFHIASGDATDITEFDVLVNSENNTMQMARFFEGKTLSYAIRAAGALIENETALMEDTIQDELYRNALFNGGLPVHNARVLATSAGHPQSEMRQFTDYRYIFHVASVRVNLKEHSLEATGSINSFIKNCISKVSNIDKNSGAILLEDDDYLVEKQNNYQPITSILFPLFGTGHAGERLEKVATEIIKCFATQVPRHISRLKLNINKIGLSAYSEDDVKTLHRLFLDQRFELISED
ncbi:MAG: hypothetical protein Phog2KO_33230 [Phototrophicaceae bacterium]